MKNISHYVIQTKEDLCGGCGQCAGRCPMGAIQMVDGKPVTDASCVGCGQCAYICPTNARVLVKKDPSEYDKLPETIFDTYISMQEYRRTSGDLA
jgi:ferredoxin